jgi:hypothetical protein
MDITTIEFIIILFSVGVSCFIIGGATTITYFRKKKYDPKMRYVYKHLKNINDVSKDLIDIIEDRKTHV